MRDEAVLTTSGGIGTGELFQIFLDGRARTKAELGEITGMSRNAVSSRVDALLRGKFVVPVGSEPSSGGRRPARLAFNADAGVVLAVDLGATHATIAVTNLAASVLGLHSTPMAVSAGPTEVLDRVFEIGAELLEQHAPHKPLYGVGIGLPGPVEHSTGRPVKPPIMPGWDGFDVPEYVQRRFPVPVYVDNDVNILALGERTLSWPEVDDLVFVKVATGIGAGIISGGVLQRGSQGIAGDIGHVRVPHNKDSVRPIDDERGLSSIASGTAIAAELRAQGLEAASGFDVVRLVEQGHPAAIAATRQAGREVGEVLAMVVNTLNPSIIVIGGVVATAGDHLLAGIREVVYRTSIPAATQNLQVVQTKAKERAGVLGAAILVTQQVLSSQNVEAVVARPS